MKRVVSNFKFLKKCSIESPKKFKSQVVGAKQEEVKAIVECIANCPDKSTLNIVAEIKKADQIKTIKKLLLKHNNIVRSCIAIILTEILTCARKGLENESDESDTT